MLGELLALSPLGKVDPNLLVGTETSDDAAVYRINAEQAIVATTDFFLPIVDDPYDFGRISATNAISDVYAMGGKPFLALALVGMPLGKLPVEAMQRVLAGGHAVCDAAGIPIGGGHSIDSPEPMYGLAVLGLVHPDRVKRNDRARAGDVLILGKGLGIGIMGAALKKGELHDNAYQQMIETTTQLNTPGIALAELPGVHAMTDVTGFGLLGHLLEICRGSKLRAEIAFDAVPVLSAALHLVKLGLAPGAPTVTGAAWQTTWRCRRGCRSGKRNCYAIRKPAAACWWRAVVTARPQCWRYSGSRASIARARSGASRRARLA